MEGNTSGGSSEHSRLAMNHLPLHPKRNSISIGENQRRQTFESKSVTRYNEPLLRRRSTITARYLSLSKTSSRQVLLKDQKIKKNTYQLKPQQLLQPNLIQETIYNVLLNRLKTMSYNGRTCGALSVELSETIKQKLKRDERLQRFKIISVVYIGQKAGQGIDVASRCLWNDEFDNYFSATFHNESIFSVGLVFATYLD